MDKAHAKSRYERKLTYEQVILHRAFLVQQAEAEVLFVFKEASVHLLVEKLLAYLIFPTEALESLQIVRGIFKSFILRCLLTLCFDL